MNVLVIDGQGGGLGRQLVAALSAQCPDIRLVAVGTNSVAAQAMHKAGAQRAATGENAVVVNCRSADIIVAEPLICLCHKKKRKNLWVMKKILKRILRRKKRKK